MKRHVAKVIREYAATFAHIDPRAGRTMEKLAKRNYKAASKDEKRSILSMLERETMKRRKHASKDG